MLPGPALASKHVDGSRVWAVDSPVWCADERDRSCHRDGRTIERDLIGWNPWQGFTDSAELVPSRSTSFEMVDRTDQDPWCSNKRGGSVERNCIAEEVIFGRARGVELGPELETTGVRCPFVHCADVFYSSAVVSYGTDQDGTARDGQTPAVAIPTLRISRVEQVGLRPGVASPLKNESLVCDVVAHHEDVVLQRHVAAEGLAATGAGRQAIGQDPAGSEVFEDEDGAAATRQGGRTNEDGVGPYRYTGSEPVVWRRW